MIRLLFGFQGRINRAQYWAGTLIISLVAIMLLAALVASGTAADPKAFAVDPERAIGHLGGTLIGFLAILFVSAWCGLALQVKRFHDRGKSGWMAAIPAGLGGFVGFLAVAAPFALIGLLPIIVLALLGINIWFLIELGCLTGADGPNQFGNPPASGGSPPSSPAPTSPFDPKPQPTSLQTAEAAMERAIAERRNAPAPQRQLAVTAKPAMAAPGASTAPTSFGRRPAR